MATRRFARTDKGQAEIAQRRKNLRGKLRTLLFLVDPGKSFEEVEQLAAQIGAPSDAIAELVAGGYIVEVGAAAAPGVPTGGEDTGDELERFRIAKEFMNDTIVNALGIWAFGLTLRLEKCVTREDLAALLTDYAAALVKKLDRGEASALVQRTRELISAGRR